MPFCYLFEATFMELKPHLRRSIRMIIVFKEGQIEIPTNLMLAQFFSNILTKIMTEIVSFIFINHLVLSLQEK